MNFLLIYYPEGLQIKALFFLFSDLLGIKKKVLMDWNYEIMKFSTESSVDESNYWLESIENLSRIYEIEPEG